MRFRAIIQQSGKTAETRQRLIAKAVSTLRGDRL